MDEQNKKPSTLVKILVSIVIIITIVGIITFAITSNNLVNADTNENQLLKAKIAKLESDIQKLNSTDNAIINYITNPKSALLGSIINYTIITDNRLDLLEAKKGK